jgi:hypothetical protein
MTTHLTDTFACSFPGCEEKNLSRQKVLFPSIKAILQAENGRPVTLATLANHALCPRHSVLARPHVGGTFSHAETVKWIEERDAKRAAERATAEKFFAGKYAVSAPKPKQVMPGKPAAKPEPGKNAMQLAFDRAKVTPAATTTKPATQKVVELPAAVAASA